MGLADSFVKKEITPLEEAEQQRQDLLLEEMGLTRSDTDKLRAQMLSAKESIAAKEEELTRIRQKKGRKTEWQEFLDIKARMGHMMQSGDLLFKLKQIIPGLKWCPGTIRNTYSLVAPVTRTYDDGFHWGIDYLGWIDSRWSPEYEIDLVDKDGVAIGQKRGWRTVLLNLITRKDGDGKWVLKSNGVVQNGTGRPLNVLTEAKADVVFGYPSNGPTASIYRRTLWEFRNGVSLPTNKWF